MSSRFINSSTSWHKRTRINMLSIRMISTSLSRWHLHLFGGKIIEKRSSKRIPCQIERRNDCRFHSSRIKERHAEMNPKAHGRWGSLQNTCSDRNVSRAYQSVPRKLYPFFFYWHLFLHFFPWFLLIPLVRSFTCSQGPGHVFSQQTFRRSISM